MITKHTDDNKITVIAQDADDLLSLRRVIMAGDRIIADTTRVIKLDKDFSRPDRERIRVRISLQVQKISLDSTVDRLRISGTITESSNETVAHGSHHSVLLKTGEPCTIWKKKWSSMEKKLIKTQDDKIRFLLVAIDKSDCAIARLNGTHLEIMPNIYSGAAGKRYKTDFNIEGFFEQICKAVSTVSDRVIIFGPGNTKRKFANYIEKSLKSNPQVVEGIDSGGEDGIYTFTKSEIMKETMSESKIAKIAGIIDDIMLMASKRSKKFTMGFDETAKANEFAAIQSLVFSDKALEDIDEEKIIRFLNDVESKGGNIFSVDSSTDLGLRVTGLGGIVSTLRYAV